MTEPDSDNGGGSYNMYYNQPPGGDGGTSALVPSIFHVAAVGFHSGCLTNSFHLSTAAAVDYLAKNVSLSSQRRMKLADHSAVLGLLQVETGQAY